MVKVTGSPEGLAVAVTVYVGPPTVAPAGAVDVKAIDWLPLATANDCCTWGAALYCALPAWLASTTQVPTPIIDTVAPLSEQTLVAVASMVKVTGRPEGLAVAVTAYVGPPTVAPAGAVDVKEIVWSPFDTRKDCCSCGAAL